MGVTRLHDRWDQLNELFHEALAQPPQSRESYCRDACGDDDELREFLQELVSSADAGDEALCDSISKLAQDVASTTNLVGERVGAYRCDELIGRGGMGEVYLASRADGQFEKNVAIKVVRRKLASEDFASLSRTERQIMATLKHPAIPGLVDAGQLDDGRPYFICDFVDGVPIDLYCEQHALPVDRRLDLLVSLGEALQHAHGEMVLHLDVKPDNVLVDKEGQPSLLDFGVSRLLSEQDAEFRAFSPGYASPEQIRGDRPSAASDVFSLGALMYHLLAGDPPYEVPRFAASETILAERTQFTERLAQPDRLRGVDGDLCAIVQKAMADQPADRYASIEAFLRDLRNYRRHRPVSARQSTYVYRLGKFLRRHRVAMAVVAAAFATLAAFGFREADLRKQAAREAETAHQVSEFLVDVFEIADPTEANGNRVTARELLDRGAERIEEDLAQQPRVASSLMKTIGRAYMKLGLPKDSIPVLENALALRDPLSANDDLELAAILVELSSAYKDAARYEESERVALRAVEIRERALGPDDELVADALTDYAKAAYRQGRYEDAERRHLRRADIYERTLGRQHESYGRVLWDLGSTYNKQARYDEAEQMYLRAVPILEAAWGHTHPNLSVLYQNLGNLYGQLRRFEDASEVLAHSLSLAEPIFGADHPRMTSTRRSLGTVLMFQGELDRAETHIKQAMESDAQRYGAEDFRVGLGYLTMSGVHERRGDLDLAERDGQTALRMFEAKFKPEHTFPVYACKALASVYHKLDRPDQAEPFYRRALAHFEKLPADDPDRVEVTQGYAKLLRQTQRAGEADALEATLHD